MLTASGELWIRKQFPPITETFSFSFSMKEPLDCFYSQHINITYKFWWLFRNIFHCFSFHRIACNFSWNTFLPDIWSYLLSWYSLILKCSTINIFLHFWLHVQLFSYTNQLILKNICNNRLISNYNFNAIDFFKKNLIYTICRFIFKHLNFKMLMLSLIWWTLPTNLIRKIIFYLTNLPSHSFSKIFTTQFSTLEIPHYNAIPAYERTKE